MDRWTEIRKYRFEKESRVIHQRSCGLTLAEIAHNEQLTTERIRQLLYAGLRRRKPENHEGLIDPKTGILLKHRNGTLVR